MGPALTKLARKAGQKAGVEKRIIAVSRFSERGLAEELEPLGEYAQSCLGRERIFQYFSKKYDTPVLIYRLNYANDVSYGVLLELAKSVIEQKPLFVHDE